MADDLTKNRATGQQNRGTGNLLLNRGTMTAVPPGKPSAGASSQASKVVSDFAKRVEANKHKDMGKRPGFLQRAAVASQWESVVLGSSAGSLMGGKDYEMARKMMEHYLTADGDPLVYTPPRPVQEAIRKKFPAPGHYPNISGYGKWSTPDIRNGLGHFDLDVIKNEKGLTYIIIDRYEFPDKVDGHVVRHGFQVGKLSPKTVDSLNNTFSKFGEYKRDSGSATEKFELQKDPSTGEFTFFVPQKFLVDNGADFDSMGIFISEKPSR